jgi:hypothetical protein
LFIHENCYPKKNTWLIDEPCIQLVTNRISWGIWL